MQVDRERFHNKVINCGKLLHSVFLRISKQMHKLHAGMSRSPFIWHHLHLINPAIQLMVQPIFISWNASWRSCNSRMKHPKDFVRTRILIQPSWSQDRLPLGLCSFVNVQVVITYIVLSYFVWSGLTALSVKQMKSRVRGS